MVIDEEAYTAIKALTYLAKRGGISNTRATASAIGVKEETLLPVIKKLSAKKLINIDEGQPFPKLELAANNATAYEIISTVTDSAGEQERVEAFTAPIPSEKSRWIEVYNQVKSYEGKTGRELNGLMLAALTRAYRLSTPLEGQEGAILCS